MKNRLLPLFMILGAYSAYSQVGIGTVTPRLSAELHVESNSKGILIPNVPLTSYTDVTTITNGNVDSLLVFNTTDNDVMKPGYYYWYDNRWNRISVSGEDTKNCEIGIAGGNGAPGNKGEAGYPGDNISIYTDKDTNTVYVKNADGTWTPINGPKGDPGEVGLGGGNGTPGNKGEAGYPGSNINIYTDKSSNTVYVQNADGTWTPINGPKGDKGDKGEVGLAGGNGTPGNEGQPGYPGDNVSIYTDKDTNTVYVKNADGTWTPINGPQGAQGPAGATGAQGATGADGIGGNTVAGTNITITGAGTVASPYTVNAVWSQQVIDEYTAAESATTFTLTSVPAVTSLVKLYINGVRIDNNAVSVTGKVVTYKPASNGSYALMAGDNIIIDYLK